MDGFNGTLLTLTAPARFFRLHLGPERVPRLGASARGQNDMAQGERDQLWILDVAGKRLMEAWSLPNQRAADEAAGPGNPGLRPHRAGELTSRLSDRTCARLIRRSMGNSSLRSRAGRILRLYAHQAIEREARRPARCAAV